MKRLLQKELFKKGQKSYGGELKGRNRPRPISTQNSMHFVLRSTKAKGRWSFLNHKKAINNIIEKFARKNGVRLKSMANVGNHLHIHLQLTNRHTYKGFIRAITSAIAMAVTNSSRWNKIKEAKRFWDLRPFSRVIVGFKAQLNLTDYIEINKFEAEGYSRDQSRFMIKWDWDRGRFK